MLMLNKCVELCASKFNFNAEEAWLMIEVECGVKSGVKSVKSVKSVVKSVMPLPYNGENDSDKCCGLNKNHGLYTQCSSDRKKGEAYCSKCSKQALKNSHGLPDYGHIDKRSRCYEQGEEFVDPSGKKAIAYLKVMNKLKLTEEEVRAEASIQGITLDPRHFLSKKSGRPTKEKVEKKEASVAKKGRPKKSKKVLELAGEEDLFASLVMSANSDQLLEKVEQKVDDVIEESVTLEVVSESALGDVVVEALVKEAKVPKVKATKKAKEPKVKELSEEQKAANAAKDALAEQKKVEKAAKDALAEQKKQEKEQKVALAEQKKQEAEQKKLEAEQKKQEKEQKKLEAEQKKQEKEQKKLEAEQKKQEKEQKKLETEQKKVEKVKKTNNDDDDRPTPVFVSPPDDTDVVKKVEFEGKKYLKSKKTGIIYNMDQDVIGKWNEAKQRIDFIEEEESEDEYDEDV